MFTNRTRATPTSKTPGRVSVLARLLVSDFAATLLHVQIEILIVQIAPFRIGISIKVPPLLILISGMVSFDINPT